MNACLRSGQIPRSWQSCLMVVIPKGKGDPQEPSSYRGICKKSCVYKLLSSLLVRRMVPFLEGVKGLPDEQHGFRPGRSTHTACAILLEDVKRALGRPKNPLFAVFVDFKAAFDPGSRKLALEKLSRMGVTRNVLGLIAATLQKNFIVIDDGVSAREGLEQTTGFAQGDNLSPLLFAVLIADLPDKIKARHPFVKVLLYADDLVLYSSSRFHLQQALATLGHYVEEIGLVINKKKTEAMQFRRGGRIAAANELRLGGETIKYVSSFTYLGLTLTPTGTSFSRHIKERARKAMVVSSQIESPTKLSRETALRLFEIKVAPTAAFGVNLCWDALSKKDLAELDRVKPAFLKRVMGLHISTRNRLVYWLAGTSLFVEDIRRVFRLPETEEYKAFISESEQKRADIDPRFLETPAMTTMMWKGPNRSNRHVITREAVHGFHHSVCIVDSFHDPSEECRCKLCGAQCHRYHARVCICIKSLGELARR